MWIWLLIISQGLCATVVSIPENAVVSGLLTTQTLNVNETLSVTTEDRPLTKAQTLSMFVPKPKPYIALTSSSGAFTASAYSKVQGSLLNIETNHSWTSAIPTGDSDSNNFFQVPINGIYLMTFSASGGSGVIVFWSVDWTGVPWSNPAEHIYYGRRWCGFSGLAVCTSSFIFRLTTTNKVRPLQYHGGAGIAANTNAENKPIISVLFLGS